MTTKDLDTCSEELVARFGQRGHCITPQRPALLRLLAASENHPSDTQLYSQLWKQYPTMSLAIVYKTSERDGQSIGTGI